MANPGEWISAELLGRYRRGEQTAANEIFSRYADRLLLLAQSRLSARLANRIDAEDVTQSAWRSFFVGARNGDFQVTKRGDLWRLLATIVLHKLYRQARRHSAVRRAIGQEQPLDGTAPDALPIAPHGANAAEAQAVAEEINAYIAMLDADVRRVLRLRLQGERLATIAQKLELSERTVRRTINRARELIAARFEIAIGEQRLPERRSTSISLDKAQATESFRDPADYLLERMTGAGRFGKVYRAIEKRSGRLVAVKYLRKAFLRHPDVIDRFLHESRILAQLDHAGIVGHIGLGRAPGGSYFIVMDWVAGGNLAERLRRGEIPIAEALQWTRALCDALEHAHRRQILHCDLKPSNILLSANGCIVLTDFGFARSLAQIDSGDHRPEGTPAFMAPEQIARDSGVIDCRTDVYGVGAVLYTLLAGQPPWPQQNIQRILRAIVSPAPAPDLRLLRRNLPESVSRVCHRCLAKAPSERYSSIAEVKLALSEIG